MRITKFDVAVFFAEVAVWLFVIALIVGSIIFFRSLTDNDDRLDPVKIEIESRAPFAQGNTAGNRKWKHVADEDQYRVSEETAARLKAAGYSSEKFAGFRVSETAEVGTSAGH